MMSDTLDNLPDGRREHTDPPAPQVRHRGPRALRPLADASDPPSPVDLDRIIHERLRLGLMTALAIHDVLTFVELKTKLRTTDGNLSVHARKLEEAGFVSCTKGFDGRMPRSEYRLTHAGHKALERYVDQMESIIEQTRTRNREQGTRNE
jgi:DNA-binding HxlR family transcriptional regulator